MPALDAPTPRRAAVDAGELRRLADAATPLPWALWSDMAGGPKIKSDAARDECGQPREVCWPYGEIRDEDAAYLVAAANVLPALLDRPEQLEARERALHDVLRDLDADPAPVVRVVPKQIRMALLGAADGGREVG